MMHLLGLQRVETNGQKDLSDPFFFSLKHTLIKYIEAPCFLDI